MHGCSKAVLVYGFNIGDTFHRIDNDYINDVFPSIEIYATEVIRITACELVYGIPCIIDAVTGHAIIGDDQKQIVKNLYDRYISYLHKEYYDAKLEDMLTSVKLGYTLAVEGDYMALQKKIFIDDDYYSDDENDIKEPVFYDYE